MPNLNSPSLQERLDNAHADIHELNTRLIERSEAILRLLDENTRLHRELRKYQKPLAPTIDPKNQAVDYFRTLAQYYLACWLNRRPSHLPETVQVLVEVMADDLPHDPLFKCAPGVCACHCNEWGAVTVTAQNGKQLGLKPLQFTPVSWRANPAVSGLGSSSPSPIATESATSREEPHNPRNAPADKVPEGWRFLTQKEFLHARLLFNDIPAYVKDLRFWAWIDNSWSKYPCGAYLYHNDSLIVPLSWSVHQLQPTTVNNGQQEQRDSSATANATPGIS